MTDKKELTKISKNLSSMFSKIEIHECFICGDFIGAQEFKQFEGVCKKHWDE